MQVDEDDSINVLQYFDPVIIDKMLI